MKIRIFTMQLVVFLLLFAVKTTAQTKTDKVSQKWELTGLGSLGRATNTTVLTSDEKNLYIIGGDGILIEGDPYVRLQKIDLWNKQSLWTKSYPTGSSGGGRTFGPMPGMALDDNGNVFIAYRRKTDKKSKYDYYYEIAMKLLNPDNGNVVWEKTFSLENKSLGGDLAQGKIIWDGQNFVFSSPAGDSCVTFYVQPNGEFKTKYTFTKGVQTRTYGFQKTSLGTSFIKSEKDTASSLTKLTAVSVGEDTLPTPLSENISWYTPEYFMNTLNTYSWLVYDTTHTGDVTGQLTKFSIRKDGEIVQGTTLQFGPDISFGGFTKFNDTISIASITYTATGNSKILIFNQEDTILSYAMGGKIPKATFVSGNAVYVYTNQGSIEKLQILGIKTGVQNTNPLQNDFKIFPNPANISTNIVTPSNTGVIHVKLMNVMGKTIENVSFTGTFNVLSLENIPKGIYIVEIQDTEHITSLQKLQIE